MRRMSDGVEQALHCALILAGLPKGELLPAKELATFHGVSESDLLTHLKALAAAGVVRSVPGPAGGYCLARVPGEVTMLDVVEAIDGKAPAFRCSEIRRRGPAASSDPCLYKQQCFIKRRMIEAEAAWRERLRTQTLEELLEEAATSIDPGNMARGLAWLRAEIRLPR